MPSNLAISFWIAFASLLLGPLLLPSLHLYYFAPYLVQNFYKRTRLQSLWRALLCGSLVDLFSSSPFFGQTALNYCLVTFILYGQKRNFFEDKLLTLPLMTAFFTILSALIGAFLPLFFGVPHPISLRWAGTDLVVMPLFDGLYALLLFSLPFQLTKKLRRLWLRYKTR